ncbi:MAG: L-rhamnose isomerase [Promethearchaeota archaeon]|nr:MAG: L-rhamnose isomerase [Candidatus Lokiarchaeota archaeon]
MREKIERYYSNANKQYLEFGIDTDKILNQLKEIQISIPCWQGDDVGGFERPNAEISGGGIQATGNYPGKARTISELRQDFEKVLSLVPGSHRFSLHESYGDFGGKFVERNEVTPEYFQSWIEWAKDINIKLDFNSTLFSHPKSNDGFTLSSKNKEIREFWIEHVKKCREISAEMGKKLGSSCIHNLWIPDGMKDIPVDRSGHRILLKKSLDEILKKKYPDSQMIDSLEGKLFGIGSEAYVVGSHEFYLSYAIANNTLLTIDTGHFHPTESVGDKISAILPFVKGILLHISRGIRWDSDHVPILNDEIIHLAEEIVRSRQMERIHLALDFFDASINRIGAWVIGARATQKSILYALLQPIDLLQEYEDNGQYFQRLALLEECKTMPFGAVWDYFCLSNDVPIGKEWIKEIESYENKILNTRDKS